MIARFGYVSFEDAGQEVVLPGRVNGETLIIESLAVLASRTTASARLEILLFDVVPFGASGVVVIHLAVRFLLGMPRISFQLLHLLSIELN